MSEGSDVSVLYEFADTLLKYSQKMQWARLDMADLQEHGRSSRSILIIGMRAIFVRSKLLREL
jgi:hypothetical protein